LTATDPWIKTTPVIET